MKCRKPTGEQCAAPICYDAQHHKACDPEKQVPGHTPMQVKCAPSCRDKPQNDFCGGFGVTMFMSGFEFAGNPKNNCIVLFVEGWVLDTPGKFVFGCFVCFFLGMLVEAVVKIQEEQDFQLAALHHE